MKIDRNTLTKIAHLARLEVKEEEEERLLQSLSEILTWVEKLNEVETENIEPLTNMSQEVNKLRDDQGNTVNLGKLTIENHRIRAILIERLYLVDFLEELRQISFHRTQHSQIRWIQTVFPHRLANRTEVSNGECGNIHTDAG